jgi:hypothetical protein
MIKRREPKDTKEPDMITRRLTDNEIRIRIVPTHLRWPKADTSNIWRILHECVEELYDFARAIDDNCCEIEQAREYGRDEIARHRTEAGNEALKKLAAFRPFQLAERAAMKEIETFEKRDDLTSQEVQAKQRLMMAMEELRGGIGAMERLLLERCKMNERSARLNC